MPTFEETWLFLELQWCGPSSSDHFTLQVFSYGRYGVLNTVDMEISERLQVAAIITRQWGREKERRGQESLGSNVRCNVVMELVWLIQLLAAVETREQLLP